MELYEFVDLTEGIIESQEGISGVIKYSDDIFLTYFLKDNIVTAFQMFASCIPTNKLVTPIDHGITLITKVQQALINVCSVDQQEANAAMHILGMFDSSFKVGKQTVLFDYLLKSEVVEGLLLISATELG